MASAVANPVITSPAPPVGVTSGTFVVYSGTLADLLQAGDNVLAIQGHNRSLTSSDFVLVPTMTATRPHIEKALGFADLAKKVEMRPGVSWIDEVGRDGRNSAEIIDTGVNERSGR